MSLQVYYHIYLSHVSLIITTKSVVSDTARKFYQTPVYYRPSFSFNLLASVSAKNCPRTQVGLASRPRPWSSTNSCPIDVYRKLQGMILFTRGQSGDKVTNFS